MIIIFPYTNIADYLFAWRNERYYRASTTKAYKAPKKNNNESKLDPHKVATMCVINDWNVDIQHQFISKDARSESGFRCFRDNSSASWYHLSVPKAAALHRDGSTNNSFEDRGKQQQRLEHQKRTRGVQTLCLKIMKLIVAYRRECKECF